MPSQPHKFSVLLVDDEVDFLKNVSAAFERHYHVRTAQNGKDALAILANEKDESFVVLSDQRMPGMTGLELFAEIKNQKIDHLGRFLFTGYGEMALAIEAFNDGLIQNYLEKPITWEKIELLRKYIDAAVGDSFYQKWLERKIAGFPQSQRSVTMGRLLDSIVDFFREPIHDMLQRQQLLAHQIKECLKKVNGGPDIPVQDIKASLEKMSGLTAANQTTFAYVSAFFDSVGSFEMISANNAEKHPVNHILLAAVASVKTLLVKKDIVVKPKLSAKEALLQCIPSDLYMLFVNLLMRAIDVSADSGWIHVECRVEVDKIVYVIEDNAGKGSIDDPALFFDGSRDSDKFDLSFIPSIVDKYQGAVRSEAKESGGYRVILEFPTAG